VGTRGRGQACARADRAWRAFSAAEERSLAASVAEVERFLACRSPSKSSRPPRPDRPATADRYDRAMAVIASIFVALAALLHGYIFLMESVWWTRPST
jgi:hypothetical protein